VYIANATIAYAYRARPTCNCTNEGKGQHIAPLAEIRLVNSSALQSQIDENWQLIGT